MLRRSYCSGLHLLSNFHDLCKNSMNSNDTFSTLFLTHYWVNTICSTITSPSSSSSSLQVGRVDKQSNVPLAPHLAAKPLTDPPALRLPEGRLPWPNPFLSSPWTPAHHPPHPLKSRGRERGKRLRSQIHPVNPTTKLQDPGLEHHQGEDGDRRPRGGYHAVERAC